MTDYTQFVGRTDRTALAPEAADILRFAQSALDGHSSHGAPAFLAPPTYAFVLAAADGGFPFPTEGLIHAEQAFAYAAPIRAGERLGIERTLRRARRRGEGDRAVWVLHWEVRLLAADGSEACSLTSRLLARPRAAAVQETADADEADAGGTRDAGEDADGAVERAFVLDSAVIAAYADSAGDHNPIHLDEAAARAYGLSGVVAHGMLSMALVAQLAEEWAGGGAIASLVAKFVAPVAAGERVVARARPEGTGLALSLVGADGTVRLRGRASR